MIVTIERSAFLKSLGHVQSVVERRNTIPILANVLLQADGSTLSLTATDLDIEISETAPADVGRPGAATAPAHTLFEIVKRLPEGTQARLEVLPEEGRLKLSAGRSQFTLQILPDDEFPALSADDLDVSFTLAAGELKRLIDRSHFAMSQEETRYYLNGVYLHTHADDGAAVLRAAATDGHRLARVDAEAPAGSEAMPGVIVPRKTVLELRRLLDDADEPVSVSVSPSKIRFRFGDLVLTSKLVDGSFPDYQRVIPSGNDKTLRVETDDFKRAVDRVATVSADRTRSVKMVMDGDRLRLAVNNPEAGSALEELSAAYDGDPLEIGFNAKYLTDVANQIDGGSMSFLFADAASPTLIFDEEETRALYVLMPLRV